jgi:hypothetical protein
MSNVESIYKIVVEEESEIVTSEESKIVAKSEAVIKAEKSKAIVEENPNIPIGVVNCISTYPTQTNYFYYIFHVIMSFIALYLSFRCNRGFDVGSFLAASLFPYIYIIYILSTRGTCGIIAGEK